MVLEREREVIAELLGPGAKVFDTRTGTQLNPSSVLPKQPSPALPGALTDVKLDEVAQKRLEQFKADFLRQRGSVQFYSKCFGGAGR